VLRHMIWGRAIAVRYSAPYPPRAIAFTLPSIATFSGD
jgi:hypothetical protein